MSRPSSPPPPTPFSAAPPPPSSSIPSNRPPPPPVRRIAHRQSRSEASDLSPEPSADAIAVLAAAVGPGPNKPPPKPRAAAPSPTKALLSADSVEKRASVSEPNTPTGAAPSIVERAALLEQTLGRGAGGGAKMMSPRNSAAAKLTVDSSAGADVKSPINSPGKDSKRERSASAKQPTSPVAGASVDHRFSAALPSVIPKPPPVANPPSAGRGPAPRRAPAGVPVPPPAPVPPSHPPPAVAPHEVSAALRRRPVAPARVPEHIRVSSVDGAVSNSELEAALAKSIARRQSGVSSPVSGSSTPTKSIHSRPSDGGSELSLPPSKSDPSKAHRSKSPSVSDMITPRTTDMHGNYLPPTKSVVLEIFVTGMACAKRVQVLNDQFVQPIMSSEFAAQISDMQDKHCLNFSVEEAVFPLVNLHSCFAEFGKKSYDLDGLQKCDNFEALEKTMYVCSQFGTPQVANNLKHFVESFNKLQYLLDVALPQKSKRKEGGLAEEDLEQPVIFLTNLESNLNLLVEILKVEFAKNAKYVVVFEEIVKNLTEFTKLEGWKAIFRKTVLDLNKLISASVDRNLLPDILDHKIKLIRVGIFQRNNTMAFMTKLKPFKYFLFSNLLVWTSPSGHKFKGSLLLTHRMIVGRSRDHSMRVFVTMPSLTDKKTASNNIDFYFDQHYLRDIFDYFLTKVIAELPKETAQEVDRVISAPSKKNLDSLFSSNSKKNESSDSVSRPFNVQVRQVINFNMEWQGDIEEQIRLVAKVGSGGFGTVYRAQHIESGMEMAAKLVAAKDTKQEQAIRKEIELLKILKHDNIVSYYGCAGPDKKGLLWILMDFCSAGSLSGINSSSKKSGHGVAFTEQQIGFILSKVLLALVYLHQRNIIHRDIKCGNILLTSKGSVRLADFGVSKQISLDNDTMSKGIVGSAHWLPPEALGNASGDSEDRVTVGAKGDVWALGITAIEMAEGVPPNFELPPFQAMMKTLSDPPPKLADEAKWSSDFQQFVGRCLEKNPENRPGAGQLLQDPFIIQHIVKPDVSVLAPLLASEEGEKKSALGVPGSSPRAGSVFARPSSPAEKKEQPAVDREQEADETFLATHTIIIDDDDDDFGSEEDAKVDESPKAAKEQVKASKKKKNKGNTLDESEDGYGSDLNSGDEFELNTQTIVADYD